MLAAGRSRRMGRPKQLLPLHGETTVIETVVHRLRPLVQELVVVVGHVGGQVAALLTDCEAIIAVNPHVDQGMLSSVQVGIRAASADTDAFLICLGDQPSVSARVVDQLLTAASGGAGIVVPSCKGRRGHPVLLHRRYGQPILSLDAEDVGLNVITRGHPDDTLEVIVDDARILDDMDTPADYARERDRASDTLTPGLQSNG